jgi:hypothetical protein
VYRKPKVTIKNAKIGGETVTGTFVFPTDVRYELGTESEDLFQASGTTAVVVSAVLSFLEDNDLDIGEGIRQELSKDIGGGLHTVELDFTGIDQHDNQWGDTGNGGTKTDATGEDVHAQMCVLDHYIQRTTIDSENPAILEIAEYSQEGRYAPLKVVPRNPNAVFDSAESASVWDGSITWVETVDLRQPLDTENQEER